MKYNFKKILKEVIIGLISSFIVVISIFNYFNISLNLTDSGTQIDKKYIYLALFAQIVNSVLFIIFIWGYNKLNKKFIFSILFILIVSFIVPVMKKEQIVYIVDKPHSVIVYTRVQKYEYYYNIYLYPLKKVPTDKIQTIC